MNKELEKKLVRLDEIKDELEIVTKEKIELHEELQKIFSTTRKLRIKKVKMGYEIVCTGFHGSKKCRNIYTSTKNPDAELKDDRPQCRECGTRMEAKK